MEPAGGTRVRGEGRNKSFRPPRRFAANATAAHAEQLRRWATGEGLRGTGAARTHKRGLTLRRP